MKEKLVSIISQYQNAEPTLKEFADNYIYFERTFGDYAYVKMTVVSKGERTDFRMSYDFAKKLQSCITEILDDKWKKEYETN